MAPKRCLFDLDLDLCLVKQIRPNNSVIEDIGERTLYRKIKEYNL